MDPPSKIELVETYSGIVLTTFASPGCSVMLMSLGSAVKAGETSPMAVGGGEVVIGAPADILRE